MPIWIFHVNLMRAIGPRAARQVAAQLETALAAAATQHAAHGEAVANAAVAAAARARAEAQRRRDAERGGRLAA